MKKNNKYKKVPGICPRCLREDTRSNEEGSVLKCKVCGYHGHWLQFNEGQESRKLVQEMFTEGRLTGNANKLRGDPLLGSGKKPLEKN